MSKQEIEKIVFSQIGDKWVSTLGFRFLVTAKISRIEYVEALKKLAIKGIIAVRIHGFQIQYKRK